MLLQMLKLQILRFLEGKGEDLTVSGNGSIVSKDVGNGKSANVSGLTLGNGVSGTAEVACFKLYVYRRHPYLS